MRIVGGKDMEKSEFCDPKVSMLIVSAQNVGGSLHNTFVQFK